MLERTKLRAQKAGLNIQSDSWHQAVNLEILELKNRRLRTAEFETMMAEFGFDDKEAKVFDDAISDDTHGNIGQVVAAIHAAYQEQFEKIDFENGAINTLITKANNGKSRFDH